MKEKWKINLSRKEIKKEIKSIIDDKWLLTFIINLNLSSVWIFFQY